MKKRILSYVLAVALLLPLIVGAIPDTTANAAGVVDSFIQAQKDLLDEPDMEYRPGTRWWMAEGLHTDETIVNTVKELYDMGIGLIEFVCRDGGARVPDDLDPEVWPDVTRAQEIYSWGSEEWRHDSMLAIQEATKYGMGFSITSGTNWGNANVPREYLKPDDDGAGKSLGYKIQVVENGETFNGVLPRSYIANSSSALLEPEDLVKRQDLVSVVAMKRDPSSDATFATGTLEGTIAMTNSDPDRVMVYDDSATVVLTEQVMRDGVPVTKDTMIDPTGEAEFTLSWTPPDDGTWDIYCFWVQATGQSPTPSSDVNFTINYVDPAGVEVLIDFYENEFFAEDEFKEIIRENGKGEIYMDSIEISTTNGQTGQFWGLTFMDMFKERHGYDLDRYLPYLIRSGSRAEFTKYHTQMLGSDGVMEEKIRSDVYDVMTACYVDNVLTPLKTWLNEEMNMKLRAEIAYNLPYEVSLSGRGVDYVEGESLDYGEQIETFRTTAGAANVYGKRLSSETGALSGQNYAHGLERYMRTVNTQFAGGVQYTVWHGYSSLSGPVPLNDDIGWGTANQTWWPGGEVMSTGFSDRIGPRQPAFAHYGDFMTKIARDQAVLQQGKAQIDLAILKTDYYNTHNYEGSATDVDTMRNRKAMFMKDLSLQDAGYTYNYFAPENLEILAREGITEYRDGEGLIPDNAGYQAVIVYQENLRVESAEKLLELAGKGLPVVIVNGLTARHMTSKGANNYGQAIGESHPLAADNPHYVATSKLHEKAAVYTLGNDGREGELADVMNRLKALDNVTEISPEGLPNDPVNPDPEAWGYDDEYFLGRTGILEALQELGVRPRAEFVESNQNYLTTMRRTDDTLYLWVYNFMSDDEFKPTPVTFELENTISISVDEVGKPYTIDTWTGDISELGAYTVQDGRTSFDMTLAPGETTIIALDLNDPGDGRHAVSTDADKALLDDGVVSVYAAESGTYTTLLSDGSVVSSEIQAPDDIHLTEWDLTVYDWTRGELVEITENRGLGYTTTEAYWTTKKTPIKVGKTALVPWKDIPAVGPAVSGTGTYTTTFVLPEDWSNANGAYLDIESIGRNTAYVWVNGQRAPGLDIVALTLDVSELLRPGENTIEVEVSSTLRNRMIDMEYPGVNPNSTTLPDPPPYVGRPSLRMPVADYGMTGEVSLVTYTRVDLVDKRALQELYDECGTLSANVYTAESWSALETAMTAAASALADDDATQAQVDAALTALQAAYDGLVAVYTVTFVTGSDTVIPAQTVASGGRVTEPAAPTRDGYVFEGWYTDATYTTLWNFATGRVTGDMTLYAGWRQLPGEETYTVTFDSRGGSPVASVTAEGGKTIAEPDEPTRRGYTFTGWYKDTACTDEWNFAADTVAGDTTLYAGWEIEPGKTVDEDIWDDGTVVTTVEDEETGDKTVYVDGPDGTETVVDVPAEGEITAEIKLGEGVDETVVVIPLDDLDGGTVAIIVHEDGTEEIIKWSIADDGKLYIPVDGDVTVKIVQNGKSFTDEDDAVWAKDAIAFVTARELFLGTSDTEFAPNLAMSRGMLATVLYRLEGEPEVGENPFEDVEAGEYYEAPITWAEANGVVKGTGGNFFSPKNDITREELAVMLHRYAGEPEAEADMSHFPDADKISDWAEEAMTWALAEGIITGKDGNMAEPGANATRAEVATMLQRFILAG